MRQILLPLLTAALLAGCGTAPTGPAALRAPGQPGAMAVRHDDPYVQVLRTERQRHEQVQAAAEKFIADFKPEVPTGANGALEPVKHFRAIEMFQRETRVGVEVIGKAEIAGTPSTPTFEPHTVVRDFRLKLNAGGKLFAMDWETAAIADEPLARLKPKALSASAAKKFQAELKAFLNLPEQAEQRKLPLWKALAGQSPEDVVKLTAVKATAGAFGAFGRVFTFEATLSRNGQVILDRYPLTAVADKAGKLSAAE